MAILMITIVFIIGIIMFGFIYALNKLMQIIERFMKLLEEISKLIKAESLNEYKEEIKEEKKEDEPVRFLDIQDIRDEDLSNIKIEHFN